MYATFPYNDGYNSKTQGGNEMKKTIWLVVAAILMFSMVACSPAPSPTTSESKAPEQSAPSAPVSTTPAEITSEGAGKTPPGGKAIKEYVIGVSPLTTQHEYYIAYLQGIQEAADARGVKVVITDPSWDIAKQASQVEDFVAQKLDAIICSPVNPDGIKPTLISAQDAGIPVLVEMTLVDGVYPLIGTNQYEGAYLAGEYAGKWINEKYDGKCEVGILDYPYFQNVIDRVKGFTDGLKATCPTAEIVSVIDAGATMEGALTTMEDMLQAFPNIRCVFGINGDSAKGANSAFEQTTINPDDVCILGFDADAGELKVISEGGFCKASVAAVGTIIGATCIDAAIRKIEGEDLGEWVEVDASAQFLVTPENIDQHYSG